MRNEPSECTQTTQINFDIHSIRGFHYNSPDPRTLTPGNYKGNLEKMAIGVTKMRISLILVVIMVK